MTIENTLKYSSVKNRKKLEEENKLEQEIIELETENNKVFSSVNEDKIANFARTKETLIERRNEKIEGVMLRSVSRYQDLGENLQNTFLIWKIEIILIKVKKGCLWKQRTYKNYVNWFNGSPYMQYCSLQGCILPLAPA